MGARRTSTIMTEAEANPYMATTNHVDLEIDPPTGLPKLSIELLPETEPCEPYEPVKDKDSGRQSHQAFLQPRSGRHYVYPGEMSASKVKCSQCQVTCTCSHFCTCLCMCSLLDTFPLWCVASRLYMVRFPDRAWPGKIMIDWNFAPPFKILMNSVTKYI